MALESPLILVGFIGDFERLRRDASRPSSSSAGWSSCADLIRITGCVLPARRRKYHLMLPLAYSDVRDPAVAGCYRHPSRRAVDHAPAPRFCRVGGIFRFRLGALDEVPELRLAAFSGFIRSCGRACSGISWPTSALWFIGFAVASTLSLPAFPGRRWPGSSSRVTGRWRPLVAPFVSM